MDGISTLEQGVKPCFEFVREQRDQRKQSSFKEDNEKSALKPFRKTSC
jgi:hypothetical protein